jgi:hypothetical protein
MSTLDFSDILFDEELGTTFDVIRRNEVVSEQGRSVVDERTYNGIKGVIVPGDPGNIMRKDDSQMTGNVITVSTVFRLRPAGWGFQPDIVVHEGVRFTVKALKRWTNMGSGFVKAVAESQNAADPAPL